MNPLLNGHNFYCMPALDRVPAYHLRDQRIVFPVGYVSMNFSVYEHYDSCIL